MPYTDKFTTKLSNDPAYRALYFRLINNGIKNSDDLRSALSLLDDASLSLRTAAAYGHAPSCLTLPYALKFLGRVVDAYMGNPLDKSTFQKYLFQTSSNSNSALDWALVNSGPVPKEERGEYAVCVALLLKQGLSEGNLKEMNKYPAKPLLSFIRNFKNIETMHERLNFQKAFLVKDNPESTDREIKIHTSLHYLAAHYFMLAHKESLDKFVEQLKLDSKTEINIVEIGCSVPYELPALLEYFSAKGIKTHYQGFDIDNRMIGSAKLLYDGVDFQQGSTLNFEVKSAVSLSESSRYKGKSDLILLRHPDVTNPMTGADFKRIISNTIPQIINESGILLASCYWDKELPLICSYLGLQETEAVKNISDYALYAGGVALGATGGANLPYYPDQFSFAVSAKRLEMVLGSVVGAPAQVKSSTSAIVLN